MEEEQLLLATDLAVIPLGRLLLQLLPLLELLGIGERDAVDTLQSLSVGLALPVRGGVLGDLQSLYLTGVADVGSTAEIDKRAALVDSGAIGGHLLVENANLELVVLEHLQQVGLLHLQTLEILLLLDDLLDQALHGSVVVGGDLMRQIIKPFYLLGKTLITYTLAFQVHVIVEPIFYGRAVT